MRPRVVDTSVLYAALNIDQPGHAMAREMLADEGPLVIPGEVAVEVFGVVVAKAGRAQARQALGALRSLHNAEWIHRTDVLEVLAIQEAHPKLSLADAAGISHAWRLGCDLDTFDRAQKAVYTTGGHRVQGE